MAIPLLTLTNIHLRMGREPLLAGAELNVAEGDRICLVGRNGSGKSTLLKIAAGLVEPDDGTRFMHPGSTLRYLAQEADLTGYDTTLAYVEAGLGPMQDAYQARYLLGELGLTGEENPEHLSGGEARRAALARALAAAPDILLLDEPTNHLDIAAIEWLESYLKGLRTAFVLISHDRRFLEALSRSTVWIDRGIARRIDRGFGDFEAWRDSVLEQEEVERHKLDRKILREDQWMHGGVTGRRKRNMRRVRELQDMREARREQRQATGSVRLEAAEASSSGRLVIEALGIAKSYDGIPIVADFSVRILRGDRLALVGPNGAGKTTLIKLLTGQLEPDQGTVRIGTKLEMVTIDQGREALNPEWTLAHTLTGGRGDSISVNGEVRHVVSYMKDFLFASDQARSPVKVLSGGERARLLLARALAKPSNFLVLDEPTNDLDMETLDLLQEMLSSYNGTVILVSHDRDFLDRIATSVVVSEGEGHWTEYPGGYTDMLAQRAAGSSPASLDSSTRTKPAADELATTAKDKASTSRPAQILSEGPKPSRKLSFKDKHALDTLPATMAKLEAELARLKARLAEPDLYSRDRPLFDKTMAGLSKVEGDLQAAEEDWLRIEMLREEIESGSRT